jgi:flagellar biosynthetic protein FlhB
MAEQEMDRGEAATPYKLGKARERGQVPKSADVVSVLVFTVAMVFLTWRGWAAWREQFRLDGSLLAQAATVRTPAELWSMVSGALRTTLVWAVPFFVALLVAAIAGNLLQIGPLFSAHPITPDWSRVSPVSGLKRLFTWRTLFQGARAVLKLVLLAWIVSAALRSLLPHAFKLSALPPAVGLRTILGDMASLGLRIAIGLWIIAIIDLVHTRREYANEMRMSRRELREEVKHREGDPRIRARMRELRREMLKRAMALRKTRSADVVITNPTHVAVALRYVHGEMDAPRLVAKGMGPLAAVIREIAARHRIPVVQNPSLARRLYQGLALDSAVPPELYAQVARIVVWVFALRRPAGDGAGLGREGPAWNR